MNSVKMSASFLVVLLFVDMATKVSMRAVKEPKTLRTAVDGWPKPTDTCTLTNCGRTPLNLTISPWPPILNRDVYISVDGFAAHSFYDGVLTLSIDAWPFPLEYGLCESSMFEGFKCPIEKGDKFHASFHALSVDLFGEKLYSTIENTKKQLLLCLDFKFKVKNNILLC